ncbi:MAG: holo-ACP synthase [Deltaproteobacteria bacterium]|nr:holo-ACP synthase [Deltaproteobacteria bacterium]
MIHGVGIDIVDINKFKKALDRWGDKIVRRLFTEDEVGYCSRQRHPERHLAVRFAAKESVFKALGRAVPFKDVEITRGMGGGGGGGRPSVRIRGLEGGFRFFISLSHDGSFAVSQTVVERLGE